jgi:hypothetical protein
MESSKLSLKFFLRDGSSVHADAFVPVFHHWIQTHALPGHMLVDVADYKHVPNGPGTVLVSHEANIYTDSTGGRLGLLYQRKTPIEGDLTARLREVFRAALIVCKMLEEAPELSGKVSFPTDVIEIRVHDRLQAPNTAETFTAVKPAVEAFLAKLYGAPVKLAHTPSDETLFEIKSTAPTGPTATELLARLT